MPDGSLGSTTRVVLRPIASPLPLGFLALAAATVLFSAVQLQWIPTSQSSVAALTVLATPRPSRCWCRRWPGGRNRPSPSP